ncbi:MAG: hypothetical protein JNK16_07395 [Phycisphaerales bacterium]|nr:hypothetical protein [Phycisphaerales bacterium]
MARRASGGTHPTIGVWKSNPHAKQFLLGAHLFAGTWVERNRARYEPLWKQNWFQSRTTKSTGVARCPRMG